MLDTMKCILYIAMATYQPLELETYSINSREFWWKQIDDISQINWYRFKGAPPHRSVQADCDVN